jgi:hypothetical protein
VEKRVVRRPVKPDFARHERRRRKHRGGGRSHRHSTLFSCTEWRLKIPVFQCTINNPPYRNILRCLHLHWHCVSTNSSCARSGTLCASDKLNRCTCTSVFLNKKSAINHKQFCEAWAARTVSTQVIQQSQRSSPTRVTRVVLILFARTVQGFTGPHQREACSL